MYCSNCGQELSDDAKFCSKCGAKVQEGTQTERQDDKQEQSSIHCPVCNHTDKMEKVSAIVDKDTQKLSGTSQEWVSDKNGGYLRTVPVTGQQMSELAKKLAAPPQPQAKGFSLFFIVIGVLLLINAVISLLSLNSIGNLICFATYLIPLIIIYLAKTNHDKKEQARVASEEPPWNSAKEVWNRLYYCYRDDIVFDGGDIKNTCQPQDVIKFCYQQN